MKVALVRVGNSRGVRIPKPVIRHCGGSGEPRAPAGWSPLTQPRVRKSARPGPCVAVSPDEMIEQAAHALTGQADCVASARYGRSIASGGASLTFDNTRLSFTTEPRAARACNLDQSPTRSFTSAATSLSTET